MLSKIRYCGLALLIGLACQSEDTDILDRDVLNELAKSTGTSRGSKWSGSYRIESNTLGRCECLNQGDDPNARSLQVQVCEQLRWTKDSDLRFQVIHTDGRISLQNTISMTGPMNDDGSFQAVGIQTESLVVGKVDSLAHLVGQFTGKKHTRAFTGTLHQRFSGKIEDQLVDCRMLNDVEGVLAELQAF